MGLGYLDVLFDSRRAQAIEEAILEVQAGSPLRDAGFQTGDYIIGQTVNLVGTYSSNSGDLQTVGDVLFLPDSGPSGAALVFTAGVESASVGDVTKARVYNVTDGVAVAGSEVSADVAGPGGAPVYRQSITQADLRGKEVRFQVKSPGGNIQSPSVSLGWEL